MELELPNLPYEKLLSAKEVGAEFGASPQTVYRWWHEGLPNGHEIPRHFMRRKGWNGLLFHPQLIRWIREEQSKALD